VITKTNLNEILHPMRFFMLSCGPCGGIELCCITLSLVMSSVRVSIHTAKNETHSYNIQF